VWAHINDGQNLNGAHDSLIDAKAQSDVFLHPHFIPYVNKKESIQPIEEIFTKTTVREWKKEMEPTRPVHSPWIEISKEKDVRWSPTGDDVYTSSAGGGNVGPSSEMQEVIRSTDSLAAIFMFMVPLTFFTRVAQFTDKFCYKDWVIEKFGKDRDGDKKKRRHFVHVPAKQGRHTTPGRRHRADKEKKKYNITAGFVICWVAALILQGAHFGADKRSAGKLWRAQPYGISIPYLQNTMTRDAYIFM